MGIDPIGKSGGPGQVAPATSGATGVTGTEEFSVEGATKPSNVDAMSPLERLRAGDIDVDGYLDLRVEQATAHLVDRVDGQQLAFVRTSLRSQLEKDPALVQLVQRATGSVRSTLDHG